MHKKTVRTRFAPSPTGLMHLGNVRTALMNFLFARQQSGAFVLRVEDTDPARNVDPGGQKIISDLHWLSLNYDEGPHKGGHFGPYFQSERMPLYQEKLQELQHKNLVYRCFCTQEELDHKRQRQITMKQPPRYDQCCLKHTDNEVQALLTKKTPFIWRLKLDPSKNIEINDLARGTITFDLKNFSDFPLTRADGSFTFMFANAIDDLMMKITHVFRGNDHLSNTAGQAALFFALDAPLPVYWHMPILCNAKGKKLSKRDFGFSLHDLRKAGYLPEAIVNYLAIIGGGTFKSEVLTLEELTHAINFESVSTTGQVRYDIEKLNWINHEWIMRYDQKKLTDACLPYLREEYPEVSDITHQTLTQIIQVIKTDLQIVADITKVLNFYFAKPRITRKDLEQFISSDNLTKINSLVSEHLHTLDDPDQFLKLVKTTAKEQKIGFKDLFTYVRLLLTGEPQGPSIHDLVTILGVEETRKRLSSFV